MGGRITQVRSQFINSEDSFNMGLHVADRGTHCILIFHSGNMIGLADKEGKETIKAEVRKSQVVI